MRLLATLLYIAGVLMFLSMITPLFAYAAFDALINGDGYSGWANRTLAVVFGLAVVAGNILVLAAARAAERAADRRLERRKAATS